MAFGGILAALAVIPTGLLESLPPTCIFRTVVLPYLFRGLCPASGLFAHCYCPACGLTRAISHLLHADVAGAYAYNPLAFIVLPLVLGIILVDIVTLSRKK